MNRSLVWINNLTVKRWMVKNSICCLTLIFLFLSPSGFAEARDNDRIYVIVRHQNRERMQYEKVLSEIERGEFPYQVDDIGRNSSDAVLEKRIKELAQSKEDKPKAVIALGEWALRLATECFSEQSVPIISTLIYNTQAFAHHRNLYLISLLPTVDTQLNYLRLMFPEKRRMGIIYSEHTADLFHQMKRSVAGFNKCCKSANPIVLESEIIHNPGEVWDAWLRLSDRIDILWMIPEPSVYLKLPLLQKDSVARCIPIFALGDDNMKNTGVAVTLSPEYSTIGSQVVAKTLQVIDNKDYLMLTRVDPPIGTRWAINRQTSADIGLQINPRAAQIIDEPILNAPNADDIHVGAGEKNIQGLLLTEAIFEIQDSIYVTTASRRKERVQKAPSIMTVIGRDDIRFRQARTLTEVLQTVPGFNITIDHLGDYNIEIRGNRSYNKFLVMIDSHPLNNQTFGGVRYVLDAIPMSIIEKIEIVRGPGSALYGENAFVGVINIIPRTGLNLKSAAVNAGSFDTYSGELLYGSAGEKLNTIAAGMLGVSDGNSRNIEADAEKLSGTTHDDRKRQSLYTQMQYAAAADSHYTLSGFYSRSKRGPYIGQVYVLNDESERVYSTYFMDLAYKKTGSRVDFECNLSVDQFIYDAFWELEPEGWPVDAFENGQLAHDQSKDIRTGIETQIDVSVTGDLNLTVGGGYYYAELYDVTSEDNYTPSVNENESFNFINLYKTDDPWIEATNQESGSAFAQFNYRPRIYASEYLYDAISIVGGLRYDRSNRYGDFYSPRVGLVLGPFSDVIIKGLYGKAFRSPNFYERKAKKQGDSIGNPSLASEEIDTYETEIYWDGPEYCKVRFNLYYNTVENLIEPDPDRSTTPKIFVNSDEKIQQYGFEASFSGTIGDQFVYNANCALINGDNTDLIPRQKSNLMVGYSFLSKMTSYYHIGYFSRQKRSLGDAREDIDAYCLHDIGLTAMLMKPGLEMRFDVRNLFDRHFVSPDPQGQIPGDYPMPGRRFELVFTYHWPGDA